MRLKRNKWVRLAVAVREQIGQGVLSPGCRLPTWEEFETQFGVSRITIHTAMRHLKHEGYIRAFRNRGTFVSEAPPNLFQYGLVLPTTPGEESWAQFYATMTSEAVTMEETSSYRMVVYQGIDGHCDNPGFRRLQEDIDSHRLAGLVFVAVPTRVLELPLFMESRIAQVSILSNPGRNRSGPWGRFFVNDGATHPVAKFLFQMPA